MQLKTAMKRVRLSVLNLEQPGVIMTYQHIWCEPFGPHLLIAPPLGTALMGDPPIISCRSSHNQRSAVVLSAEEVSLSTVTTYG